MEISGTLIEKFFNSNCTAEEAAFVADHLYLNPDLLDKYFDDDDTAFTADYLSKKESALLLKNIKQHTGPSLIKLNTIKKTLSIAASLIFIVCLYQFFSTNKKTSISQTAKVESTNKSP